MKKLLVAAALFALSAGSAPAADLAPRPYTKAPVAAPYYDWTGFYVGLNVGYAWDNSSSSYVSDGGTVTNLIAGAAIPVSQGVKKDGVTGGFQLGYNRQFDRLVVGLEGDVNFLDVGGNSSVTLVNPGIIPIVGIPAAYGPGNQWISTASVKANYIATLRARFGFAVDRTLIYATGGAAFSDFSTAATLNQGPGFSFWSGSARLNSVGWTAGGGVEHAFARNWTAKVEALYYDFGSRNYTLTETQVGVANFAITKSVSVNGVLARAGVNYKF